MTTSKIRPAWVGLFTGRQQSRCPITGGKSTRFGSDKALAVVDGKMLIEHAIDALRDTTAMVAVAGRSWPGAPHIPDRPATDLGPLGGLNGALHFAAQKGFDAVLCAPLDTYPLHATARRLRREACAVLQQHWAVGIWPTLLANALDQHLASGARSFRSWLYIAKPRLIEDRTMELNNFNTPETLSAFQSGRT